MDDYLQRHELFNSLHPPFTIQIVQTRCPISARNHTYSTHCSPGSATTWRLFARAARDIGLQLQSPFQGGVTIKACWFIIKLHKIALLVRSTGSPMFGQKLLMSLSTPFGPSDDRKAEIDALRREREEKAPAHDETQLSHLWSPSSIPHESS